MNADHEQYREHLLRKRAELVDSVRAAREGETEAGTEEAPDLGDRALSTISREILYHLSTGERETLRLIEQALDRLQEGAFGTCANCSRAIQPGRLAAVPWARFCIDCQELQDRGEI